MTLKLRVLTKFPARVLAEPGLALEQANGDYTFSLDLGSLSTADTIPDDAGAFLVILTPGATDDDPDVTEKVSVETFLNETAAVNQDRQIISGAGLTGGGDLSADRTLAVGAGTGIAVNADDVALAAQSAYTLMGNFTGSSAAPTGVNPASFTHKASPTTSDLLVLADVAASNAIKYATIAEIVGAIASGVTTFISRAGAVVAVASDYAQYAGLGAKWNYGISASVAANALTVTLTDAAGSTPSATSPSVANFRSATLTTGTATARSTTGSQSITAATGASFGSTNNTPFHLLVAEFDDAGTKRVGLMNASESGIIHPVGAYGRASSTAISSGSTSAGVWYTGTAVTDKAFVIIGRISWTATPLATAGTYANGPDVVTLAGPDFKYPGEVVQQKTTGNGTFMAGGTTLIPHDNTKPQITEGQEFYTRSITPASQANWLVVSARLHLAATAAAFLTAAIFQDANADALAVADDVDLTGNLMKRIDLDFTMLAGTVSSTTFRLRGGGNNAATYCANGVSGAGVYNGTLLSFITVTEVQG